MFNRSGVRTIVGLGAATLSVGLSAGCSSSGKAGGASGSGQVGGSAGSSSVSGSSGSTNSASGTSGTSSGSAQAGTSGSTPPGSGVSSGQASGSVVSSGGSGSSAGSMNASTGSEDAGSQNEPDGEGTSMIDAAGLTPATCAKPTPPPNDTGGAQGSRPGECDYLLQSLDFEDMYSYSTTTANIKTTGVFGLYEINDCSPYCYAKNLTVGIDIVGGGSQAQLQGDVIVEFPATGPGLPITTIDGTNANMRDALAWITFDGAAAPAFEIDTQLVVETSAGVVPAVEVKPFFENKNLAPFGPFSVANNYSYGNGSEFKYFPFTSTNGFPNGAMNVTGMGFRIVAKATAGQSWHGVAYIDHMHIRLPAAADMPAGTYPFGLQ